MEREKIKLIVRNLELLVDSLKAEVYSDVDVYSTKVDTSRLPGYTDYDEIFEEDDDWYKEDKRTYKIAWTFN